MKPAMGLVVLLLFGGGAMALSGCKKVTEGAREHFSKDFTCTKPYPANVARW